MRAAVSQGLRDCKSREAGEAGEGGGRRGSEANHLQRLRECLPFHPWGEISFHLTQLVKGKIREILGSQNLKIKGGDLCREKGTSIFRVDT